MEEEKEKGWRKSLDLSSTEEEKKMEGWTDKGLTVFSWKSKQCSYQPRVRIWGELLI